MATKKSKSALPAALSQEGEAVGAGPVKMGLADTFLRAGDQALARTLELLGIQIDVQQLADPQWLADPEHRKVATVLLKLLTAQTNLALGVISGQIRVGTAIREDVEKEAHRQAVLDQLRRDLLRDEDEPQPSVEPPMRRQR